MISLSQIEQTFKDRSWWAIIFNLYPAKYITYFLVNKTSITPNQVTTVSLLFAVFAGLAFWYDSFIAGAILYQVSFILDIVDGSIARSKDQSSQIGAFYDVFTDWLKAPVLILLLFYKLDQVILGEIVIFLFFLNCCANKYNDMLFYTTQNSITKSENVQKSLLGRYFAYMKEQRLIVLPGSVEVEGLIVFLYAISQNTLFVYFAIFLLLFSFVLRVYVITKKIK